MKKIIFISLLTLMVGLTNTFVLAVGPQQNSENKESMQQAGQEISQDKQQQATEQEVSTEEQEEKELKEMQRIREVREIISQKEAVITEGLKEIEKAGQVEMVQNKVQMAVLSLVGVKDVLGGIGEQVSEIAVGFNNSIQASVQAEEKIKNRNGLIKFFAGNDQEALKLMERETNRNQERIQQLLQLREECDCGEEVKSFLQEQVESLKQEQNKIEETIQEEKKVKGLFGRLFGWFRNN
jgi:hypothetical protein